MKFLNQIERNCSASFWADFSSWLPLSAGEACTTLPPFLRCLQHVQLCILLFSCCCGRGWGCNGVAEEQAGVRLALLHQALRVCLPLSLSVSQMSLMASGLRAALLWSPLMGLGRSLLVVLTLSCLGVEQCVLSPVFLCAAPSRATICRHEGCCLGQLIRNSQ